uniref:N-acetyltransferase domain-containing protein n=1 Tax=Moniliophthora roreri TaxID=221103 RepID=A0A0W0GDI3_MONRR
MSSAQPEGAYVRVVEPHEYPVAIRILTHAFAHDPAMNWYGSVKELVPAPDEQDYSKTVKRTLKRLYTFQNMLLRGTVLQGGIVTVAVIPNGPNEIIIGVALWLKPGQSWDFPLLVTLRSGILKVLRGWGLNGVRRLSFEFTPAVEKSLDKAFKSRSLERLDSWHLLSLAVDPSHEGKGICGLMMRDGRDIYAHYGFKIDGEHCFGKGSVDADGIAAKGTAATGYPEWIMTKWDYS